MILVLHADGNRLQKRLQLHKVSELIARGNPAGSSDAGWLEDNILADRVHFTD